MKKQIIQLVFIFYAATLNYAYAVGLEIAAGIWYQTPSGTLSYKSDTADDIIDISDDLKYDAQTRFIGRVKIDMPALLPNIYLAAAPMEFDGTGRKAVAFDFGDETFTQNIDFYSKLQFNQYDVGFYYSVPMVRMASAGKLNIDIGLNARIVELEAEIDQETTSISERKSLSVAIPMIYAAIQIMPTKRFAIEAEGRGISIGENRLFSIIGRMRYQFSGPVFAAGGYRYDKLEIDEDNVIVDAEFSGPLIEVGINF